MVISLSVLVKLIDVCAKTSQGYQQGSGLV
jgi:hypothetical protein